MGALVGTEDVTSASAAIGSFLPNGARHLFESLPTLSFFRFHVLYVFGRILF